MAGANHSHKKSRIVSNLRELKCPYIMDYSDPIVLEIVFTPGEQRLRVLQWLLSRFDPKLSEIFSQPQRQESLIPKLSTTLSHMGLCKATDQELVKGTSHFSKQVFLLETLTDMALLVHSTEDPFSSSHTELFRHIEKSCYLMDGLCRREDLNDIFPEQISILPPDIAKAFGCLSKHISSSTLNEKGNAKLDRSQQLSRPPLLPQLTKQAEMTSQQLEVMQDKLQRLSQMLPSEGVDPGALPSQHKSLAINLTTLTQLVESCRHVYQEEIQPWTNIDPPVFTDFGSKFKKMNSQMETVAESLLRLEEVQAAVTSVKNLEPLKLNHVSAADIRGSSLSSVLGGSMNRPV